MPTAFRPMRFNHMNIVYEDFDSSVGHLRQAYGAEFVHDIPRPEWHAAIIDLGRVLFEIFVPPAFLLNSRYGPHYVGIEYQADMDQARAVIAEHGVRIARDIGVAVHTHPADTFGVAFEFCADYWYEREWPLLGRRIRPVEFWRDEHPLGLTGMKSYTVAVADIAAAGALAATLLGAEPIYEAPRPAIAARAVGLQVADSVLELLTPVGEGALQQHLHRFGDGIRSTVFQVRDVDQARRHLASRGVELAPGSPAEGFAVPAAANLGVIFEFSA